MNASSAAIKSLVEVAAGERELDESDLQTRARSSLYGAETAHPLF